ncbi:hypothetical protein PBNK65E_000333900 [Plasmodium berghei]|uniref:Uncharacterized protein n=1 Tax=Plasmodium berghei TaxID=5821 RepID=A0A1D3Q3B8_PLABE|nr:hypothetical protein PBNK65E_000333900 [Plasmodium berghei]
MLHKKLKNQKGVKEFSYGSFKYKIAKIYAKEKQILKKIQDEKLSPEGFLEEKGNTLKKDKQLCSVINNDISNDFKNAKELILQNGGKGLGNHDNDESEQTMDEKLHQPDLKKSTKVKRKNSPLDEEIHNDSKLLHNEYEIKKKKKKKKKKNINFL